jgi:pseudouridine kinase
VVGAATVDIKARAGGPFSGHRCTAGRITTCAGGAARNIAENLAKLSIRPTLLTAIGTDSRATDIITACALAGVDMSRVLQTDRAQSATFLALSDENGAVVNGIHELGVLELITTEYVDRHDEAIARSSLVVADSTPTVETLKRLQEASARHKVPLVLAPTSPLSTSKIRAVLPGCRLVAPNRHELQALTGRETRTEDGLKKATRQLLELGVPIVLVTLGSEGTYYRSAEDEVRLPALTQKAVDAMGAGDAFIAGFLYGFLHKLPLLKALEIGQLTSALTMDTASNVHPKLGLDYIHSSVV